MRNYNKIFCSYFDVDVDIEIGTCDNKNDLIITHDDDTYQNLLCLVCK